METRAKLYLVIVAISPFVVSGQVTRSGDAIEGMIAHWRFDEGAGNTAYDSAGDSHGSIHSAYWAVGKNARALDFDGIDDYVRTPIRDIDMLTVAAWVSIAGETLADQQNIVNNCENGGYTLTYDFKLNKKFVFIAHINGGYRTAFSDTVIEKHKWHHVVGTYDGNDGHLYIDGVEQADSFGDDGVITDTGLPLLIGANPETDGPIEYGRCFNGKIDDVRVYNQALTPQEIQQLYQYGLSGHSLPIGPMTAVNNIERAIREQVDEWKRIDDTLKKQWLAHTSLEQVIQTGDYRDLDHSAVVTAKEQIYGAIQEGRKSKEALQKSIENLEAGLGALGYELVPKASTWLESTNLD